jgi:hypothetical protein
MSPPRRSGTQKLAKRSFELSVAVPQVVAARLNRMAAAGFNPSVRDQREFALMGAEKFQAFCQSWSAMWLRSLQMQQAWWLTWATLPQARRGGSTMARRGANLAGHAMTQVLAAGLAPVHAKAVANARRLRGR